MTNPTYCRDCKNAPSHRDRQHFPSWRWKCGIVHYGEFAIADYVTGTHTIRRYMTGEQPLCIDVNHGECSRFERRQDGT